MAGRLGAIHDTPLLRLLWEQGCREINLQAEPQHPLAKFMGNAASFSFEWPEGTDEVTLDTPGMRGFVAGSPIVGVAQSQSTQWRWIHRTLCRFP